MIAISLLIGGCDRQNTAAPQAADAPHAATSSSAASDSSSALPEHHIDMSHAGDAMPGVTITDAAGRHSTLAALRGRPVLVNLWATWCAPCLREMPTLNRLASEIKAQGHVVSVSQDIQLDHAGVQAFLATHGWTEVAAWHDPDNRLGLAYGGALPVTILFDAAGKEAARVIGPLDWYSADARRVLARAGFQTPPPT